MLAAWQKLADDHIVGPVGYIRVAGVHLPAQSPERMVFGEREVSDPVAAGLNGSHQCAGTVVQVDANGCSLAPRDGQRAIRIGGNRHRQQGLRRPSRRFHQAKAAGAGEY
jgi:hypothetical protein